MHAFTCVHGGVGGVGWGGNDVCVCDMLVHVALVLVFQKFSMRSHAFACMLSHAFMGGLGGERVTRAYTVEVQTASVFCSRRVLSYIPS